MSRNLEVAPQVEQLLAAKDPTLVLNLRAGPYPSEINCVVCGAEDVSLDDHPVSLIVEPRSNGLRLIFAHTGCERSRIREVHPGPLAPSQTDGGGMRSVARCALFGGPSPTSWQPAVVFTTASAVIGFPGGPGTGQDVIVAGMLAIGLHLVLDGSPAGLTALSDATGWRVSLRGRRDDPELLVLEPSGMSAFEGQLPQAPTGWLDLITRNRRCIVITGGQLALNSDPEELQRAAQDGRLVGGTAVVDSTRLLAKLAAR